MRELFRSVLGLFKSQPAAANRNPAPRDAGSNKGAAGEPAEVAFRVPGMTWAVGWPTRVRRALATLPWVEMGTIQMDFKTRELRFGLSDKNKFDALEVMRALKAEGFADAQVMSVPPLLPH